MYSIYEYPHVHLISYDCMQLFFFTGYFPLNCYTSLLPAPSPAHLNKDQLHHAGHQQAPQQLHHPGLHQPHIPSQPHSYESRSFVNTAVGQKSAIVNLTSDKLYHNKLTSQQPPNPALAVHQPQTTYVNNDNSNGSYFNSQPYNNVQQVMIYNLILNWFVMVTGLVLNYLNIQFHSYHGSSSSSSSSNHHHNSPNIRYQYHQLHQQLQTLLLLPLQL